MFDESKEAHLRIERYQARRAFVLWVKEMKLPWWITLNTNRDTSIEGVKRNIGHFLAHVDRYAIGNLYRNHPKRRTFLIGHIEDGTYWHCHAGIRLPEELRVPKREIEMILGECWRQVVPSGNIHLRHMRTPNDRYNTTRYSTKRFRETDFEERLVISTMFWPVKDSTNPKKEKIETVLITNRVRSHRFVN